MEETPEGHCENMKLLRETGRKGISGNMGGWWVRFVGAFKMNVCARDVVEGEALGQTPLPGMSKASHGRPVI